MTPGLCIMHSQSRAVHNLTLLVCKYAIQYMNTGKTFLLLCIKVVMLTETLLFIYVVARYPHIVVF